MSKNKVKTLPESTKDRIYLLLNYSYLWIALIIVIYPLIYVVSASFSTGNAVIAGKVWLYPVDFTLNGYKFIFQNSQILTGYLNTFIYTTVGTIINVVLTVMIAYPLSRKFFYGRSVIMVFIVFTMLFSGGLIPFFLTVRALGMLDTRWAMWIPNAVGVWQLIIARTFFQSSIPEDLSEAADMDGCSDIRFVLSIVVPLSKPIIAVTTLMYAVFHWNSFFNALIFLRSPELFPLQIILRNLLILQTTLQVTSVFQDLILEGIRDTIRFSLIVVASAPILALYPFIQKYFVKGVLIGAIKG